MTDKSDGPYIHEHEHSCEYECLACSYAKGRKAAEKFTEKMLVIAKDEVRKCHEEIRRLEDKYARNVYKMPTYSPSFDETNHAELVEKVTTEGATHWTPITNVELEILIKDFDELLELANEINKYHKECYEGCNDMPTSSRKFESWKNARGLV